MCIRKAVEHEKSVTELEMELAVLGDGAAEKIAGHALFCLRDSNLTDTLYDESKAKNPNTRDVDFYDDTQGKLIALKQKIEQSGFLGLNNYTGIEQFGSVVEAYLFAQLDHYFPAEAIQLTWNGAMQPMQALLRIITSKYRRGRIGVICEKQPLI